MIKGLEILFMVLFVWFGLMLAKDQYVFEAFALWVLALGLMADVLAQVILQVDSVIFGETDR